MLLDLFLVHFSLLFLLVPAFYCTLNTHYRTSMLTLLRNVAVERTNVIIITYLNINAFQGMLPILQLRHHLQGLHALCMSTLISTLGSVHARYV